MHLLPQSWLRSSSPPMLVALSQDLVASPLSSALTSSRNDLQCRQGPWSLASCPDTHTSEGPRDGCPQGSLGFPVPWSFPQTSDATSGRSLGVLDRWGTQSPQRRPHRLALSQPASGPWAHGQHPVGGPLSCPEEDSIRWAVRLGPPHCLPWATA